MNKVKVRIAVVVSEDGAWNSYGWSDDPGDYGESCGDRSLMDSALETCSFDGARYFIEADLDIPESVAPAVKADSVEAYIETPTESDSPSA